MNSAIVLVVGGGILGVALLLVFGGMLKRLERFKSARRVMAAIEIFHNLCLDRRECISQCLIGLAVHLSSIFAFLMLGWALRVPLDVFAGIAILPAVLLVAGLPVSIAGWGVREGGMVAGFSLLGLPASDALILSIAFGLGELGVGLVGGILWLLAGRRDSCATLPSFWSGSAAADPPP